MKNVTITLDERTAKWAQLQAVEQNMSLSRFVGHLLERTMQGSREYEQAMARYLAVKPARLKKRGARYPSRDALYDR